MTKYLRLLSLLNILLMPGIAAGQDSADWEIPVISKRVGTVIEIPEQEYYQVFDNVNGFLTAQFVQVGALFHARIQTESGLLKRTYSAKQFYDLGLAIDRAGDIDPAVLARLRGESQFEQVMANLEALPTDVTMTLFLRDGEKVKGRFVGLEGHEFRIQKRYSRRSLKVSVGRITRLAYRDPPVANVMGDARIFGVMALLGMAGTLTLSVLTGTEGFDARASHFFSGGLGGLALAPLPVRQARILRGEIHQVNFTPSELEKVRTYLFLEYGES